ncbi:hypothetical protein DCS_01432 [Drechmeria coniospora]|uniref:Transmembrane protein n=1 Tax=Drechmeria coniospora TaxID=98403 RepID=A0A151GT62_DRECN|nr:hypothetical protein DCS_01432 [Drechmeria coniospora]KYK60295.1 hypothetical protein DCS_01432 [Drechmeria coniospora]
MERSSDFLTLNPASGNIRPANDFRLPRREGDMAFVGCHGRSKLSSSPRLPRVCMAPAQNSARHIEIRLSRVLEKEPAGGVLVVVAPLSLPASSLLSLSCPSLLSLSPLSSFFSPLSSLLSLLSSLLSSLSSPFSLLPSLLFTALLCSLLVTFALLCSPLLSSHFIFLHVAHASID